MNIAAHELRGSKSLAERETATYREGFVHTDETFDPGIDEQIVANADLDSGRIAGLHEFHIEESRVEHDVTMVADKSVAMAFVISCKSSVIKLTAVSMFADDVVDNRLHETFLEVEGCPHTRESQTQQAIAHRLRQPWCKALHDDIKLSVTEQVLEGLLHLFRLIRSDLTKLLWNFHLRYLLSLTGFQRCQKAHPPSSDLLQPPAEE